MTVQVKSLKLFAKLDIVQEVFCHKNVNKISKTRDPLLFAHNTKPISYTN